MLQAIHDKVTGWIAWIIVAALVLVFALWGIDSYMKSDAKVYAAKVNGVEISVPQLQRAIQNRKNQLRQSLGDKYDPSLINDNALRQQVLQQLINQELLVQAAQKSGMTISNGLLAAQIRSIDAFQDNGKFSEKRYQQLLARQGLTPPRFETQMRRSLLISQLAGGISDTAAVTDQAVNRVYALQAQERKLAYLTIPAARFEPDAKVSDKQVDAYYQAHKQQFVVPPKVKLSYLELDISQIAKHVPVTDQELKQLYQDKKSQFTTQERRHVRHILIKVSKDAGKAQVEAARKKAESIVKKLRNGASFAKLAKEDSDDPGSADKGGDLGWFAKGAMVPAFDKAAFSLNKDQISDPVRTQFGFHVIEVTGIRPSHVKSFAQVRDELADQVRKQKAEDKFYDEQEKLANLTFEHPDTLEPAAKALKLPVEHTGWLSSDAHTGIAQHSQVMKAAFSPDVLDSGNNSQPIKLGANHIVVLRVDDHQAAKQQPLKAVHDEIVKRLREQQARKQARARGKALLGKLQSGAISLDEAAKELGVKVNDPGFVKRSDAQDDPAIVSKGFELPRPDKNAPSAAGVELGGGDYALVQVSAVRDGDASSLSKDARASLRKNLEHFHGQAEVQALVDSLRKSAEIDIPKHGAQP